MEATGKPPLKIERRPQVLERTGLSTSALYAAMSRNEFPRPVQITARAVGWRSDLVDAWIESRALSTGGKVAA